MSTVSHMKWWGWGVDGVGFHHDDKPAFAPFVLNAVGLDLNQVKPLSPPNFSSLAIPPSRASDDLIAALTKIVGDEHVATDGLDRLIHTFGKSLRDLLRIRSGAIERTPDIVVYPADEDEVVKVVVEAMAADAVLIPFGGGSGIAGSVEPGPREMRPVISVDLGRLNKVLDIDPDARLARIQAGALGPDLEQQLAKHGWTLGHFPDSFTHSSLGGWIATRSSGMQSDKYGDIADVVRGLRVVRPGGILVVPTIPSASTGPSVREMIVGSEGRLGIITEATVHIHRIPERRTIYAYLFRSWREGLAAMQAISQSDVRPSVTRLSDAPETGFAFATSKKSSTFKALATKGLMSYLGIRGWQREDMCLSFIGFEGSAHHVAHSKAAIDKIVRQHNGLGIGKGPGVLYDQKKFDTPYLRDFLLDRGAAGDVSDTAAPWSKLASLYDAVVAAANNAFAELGRKGWIMCHLSHSYHSGACLYFTFAFVFGDDPLGEYDLVKKAIQQAFVDNGGTISHHHSVGLEHAEWLEQDISPEGVNLLRGLFHSADPGNNFNPNKIVQG